MSAQEHPADATFRRRLLQERTAARAIAAAAAAAGATEGAEGDPTTWRGTPARRALDCEIDDTYSCYPPADCELIKWVPSPFKEW